MRTPRLYHQLQTLLGQSIPWADQRHLQTLISMVIGLLCSECINLSKWRVYICSRAVFAQSHQRRFSRWWHNPRINVQKLYSVLIAQALAGWGEPRSTVIEDTSGVVERVLFDSAISAISRTGNSALCGE